jgi:hypothetical protein
MFDEDRRRLAGSIKLHGTVKLTEVMKQMDLTDILVFKASLEKSAAVLMDFPL